jgi:glucokinase
MKPALTEPKVILAGDIGGTKTHLAVFTIRGGKLMVRAQQVFPSKQYTGLEPMLEEFLAGLQPPLDCACFGVAGPVVDGRVETPNLPWLIETQRLAALLRIRSVFLLNDLEAAAYGIFTLEEHELCSLNEGIVRRPANKTLIAAGTGLGEAFLWDDGHDYHPAASEGGHGDFAARNEIEIGLLRFLIERFGRVSYERVISGPGILNIYNFLKESRRYAEPSWLAERISSAPDIGVVITQSALAGEAEICVQTLNVFVSAYGAEAGNLALRGKALGGVYVGGGIAPKILPKLKDGTFMRALVDKGRYTKFASAVPVNVILNEETSLRGAAYYGGFCSNG